MRRPVRRLRDWWERRRGKRSRILDLLAGPDEESGGAGVREPRRPRAPSLSGAAAAEPPDESD
jgi:hypothetical protein